MSAIIFDFAGGTLKNIGTYDTTGLGMDLVKVGGTTNLYEPETKSIRINVTNGYCLSVNHNKNFRLFKSYTKFRFLFDIFKSGHIFATYNSPTNGPLGVGIDLENKKLYVSSLSNVTVVSYPDNFIVSGNGGKNDITFILDIPNKKVTFKNNKIGMSIDVGLRANDNHFVDGAAYSEYDQVMGLGSFVNLYNGYPAESDSLRSDIRFYVGMITYDAADVDFDVSFDRYLLYKDNKYYHLHTDTNELEEIGTDINLITGYGLSNIDEKLYTYLEAGYELLIYSTYGTPNSISITRNCIPFTYIEKSDGSYTDMNDVAKTLNEEGTLITGFTLDVKKDITITVPSNFKINPDDTLMYGFRDITKTFKNKGITHAIDIVGIKNKKRTANSVEVSERASITTEQPSNITLDATINGGSIKTSYKKPQYYYSEIDRIQIIDPDNSVDKVIANDVDVVSGRVMSYMIDATMFEDEYSFDTASGLKDIVINLKSYINIKLPKEYISITKKPNWLKLQDGSLVGIPQKAGSYELEIEMSDKKIDTIIVVSAIKRIR